MYSRLINSIFIIIIVSQICHSNPQHGLWVVRYALTSENEISKIITTAKNLKITDLYVQVRALGQVYYNSRYSKNAKTTGTSIDLFDLLVQAAKKNNIKVHAWINVLYIWSGSNKPLNTQHPYYLAERTLLRPAGSESIPQYTSLKKEGIEGYFTDPSDVSNYLNIKRIISELLERYDIDGIHLDYFRYPNLQYSLSPVGRTKFKLRNFIDPDKIYSNIPKFIAERGYHSFIYIDSLYKDILRENLTEFLQKMHDYLKAIDEKVVLSIAVKPNIYDAKHKYFQAWGDWLKQGLCDQVLMMNYETDYNFFKKNIKDAQTLGHNERIVVGISTYNQDERAVWQRIHFVSNLNFGGYALFSYNYLSENKHILDNLSLTIKNAD